MPFSHPFYRLDKRLNKKIEKYFELNMHKIFFTMDVYLYLI